MWLFTTTGFYSVVEKTKGKVQVRSRDRKHLTKLMRKYQVKAKILTWDQADYRYRIELPKKVWAAIARKMVLDIDYNNFKDRVKKTGDWNYEKLLMAIWNEGYSRYVNLPNLARFAQLKKEVDFKDDIQAQIDFWSGELNDRWKGKDEDKEVRRGVVFEK